MGKSEILKKATRKVGVSTSMDSLTFQNISAIPLESHEDNLHLSNNLDQHYWPSSTPSKTTNKCKNVLGVIIPDLRISFYAEAARGIYEEATKLGFESVLLVHDEDPENECRKLNFLSNINVDGILLNAVDETTNLKLYKKLQENGIKVVCWDRKNKKGNFSSVSINDIKAANELTERFIKKGRKNIMFIGPTKEIPVVTDRYKGYLKALKNNNLKFNKNLILETKLTYESAYQSMFDALQNGIDIDAIICAGGLVALGAANAILDNDLKIPDDILLGEFGDNNKISRLGIHYCSVNQNPYQIGIESVRLLNKYISGEIKEAESINIELEHKIESVEKENESQSINAPVYNKLIVNNSDEDCCEKYKQQIDSYLKMNQPNIETSFSDQEFVKKAVEIIDNNIDDPKFGVDRFSFLIGLSRVGLYNKLKSLTNYSVQEFIYIVKLKRAAQLLTCSGMSVTEICYEVGFKDPSHFSKVFKKQFGTSPKRYKTEHIKPASQNSFVNYLN